MERVKGSCLKSKAYYRRHMVCGHPSLLMFIFIVESIYFGFYRYSPPSCFKKKKASLIYTFPLKLMRSISSCGHFSFRYPWGKTPRAPPQNPNAPSTHSPKPGAGPQPEAPHVSLLKGAGSELCMAPSSGTGFNTLSLSGAQEAVWA